MRRVNPNARFPLRGHAAALEPGDPVTVGVSQAAPSGTVASGRSSRPFRGGGAPSGVAPTVTPNFGLGKPSTLARCRAPAACEISVRFPSAFGTRRVRGARRKDSGTIGRLGVRAAGRRASFCPRCERLRRPCNLMRESAQSCVRTKAFGSSVRSERGGRGRRPGLSRYEADVSSDRLLCPPTAHSSSGLGRRPLTAVARVRIPYAPLSPSPSREIRSTERFIRPGESG